MVGDLLRLAQGEAEQALADLLDDVAGEEVEAAVDRVFLANGWPARPQTVGLVSTRETKVADAPNDQRSETSLAVL